MAEVEMDRRSYQELQEERKNMEVAYDERIARLRAQHAEVGAWLVNGLAAIAC